MRNPYREIFRPPGTLGFASAAFVARLPIAMAPIGIVTMLSLTHGEYWLAGAVAATFTLTNAFVAPQISRLVDRFGQSRLLIPTTALSVLGFVILILAANQKLPAWTLFASALLAATMPSVPAMVRARWTEVFRARPELNTAFAFESVADELVYIGGASLSVGLSVSLFPEAGPFASTLLLAFGMTAFVLQRGTEPKVRPAQESGSKSAILAAPVQVVTVALVFVGAIFATAEVATIALTRELGQPEAASGVIAVYAAGSFILGLVIGAMRRTLPLERQLLLSLAVLFLTSLPLLLVQNVWALAAAIFLSGVAVSPTFITAFGLIEQKVAPALLTEGVTWVMTGIGIGMALGAFVSGWMVDEFGARSGFWVTLASASLAVLIVASAQRTLGQERPSPATSGAGQASPSA